MQLHELKSIKYKKAKRVGRGGKRGTTSGRGQKGQKSRSGHRIRPALRDLLIRIPKLRGFKNKPLAFKPAVFSLSQISKISPAELNLEVLKKEGLLAKHYKGTVKILGGGEITKPITISGIAVSKSARAKIEKAGGKVK